MSMDLRQLKNTLEAVLLASDQPLSDERLMALFDERNRPDRRQLHEALELLGEDCAGRGIELARVSSGYRLQVKAEYAEVTSRLWEEKPPKYSRALLETLALVAYRQPITRAEIEEIRGVSVSSSIIKTLQEREWIRVVGHRDVPGRPALYATTRAFLDYFNLKSLDELPTLAQLRDLTEPDAAPDGRSTDAAATPPAVSQPAAPEMADETRAAVTIDPALPADRWLISPEPSGRPRQEANQRHVALQTVADHNNAPVPASAMDVLERSAIGTSPKKTGESSSADSVRESNGNSIKKIAAAFRRRHAVRIDRQEPKPEAGAPADSVVAADEAKRSQPV